jgi:hypothetical protein
LVIGSLTPDLGYLFERAHVAAWAHSFWSGGVGFCLPVGLVLVWMLRGLEHFALAVVPARHEAIRSVLRRPAPTFPVLLISLLIGAWTHILLDSITHTEGWLAQRLGILQWSFPWLDGRSMKVCDLLYYGITFLGVAYLAFCFQQWLENVRDHAPRLTLTSKWAFAFLFSGLLLIMCASGRGAL